MTKPDPTKARKARDGRNVRALATMERLIQAAERLFGTYGIEAVSTRQIMLEAGVSNKSAVDYHFGDRASLVAAIWTRRLPALESIRKAMLDEVFAQGLQDDPHALAAVLMLPSYHLKEEGGGHIYAAFLGQALRWGAGRTLRQDAMDLSPSSKIATDLFRAAVSPSPDYLLDWRLRLATGLFVDAVVARDAALAALEPVMSEDTFLREIIALVVACCRA